MGGIDRKSLAFIMILVLVVSLIPIAYETTVVPQNTSGSGVVSEQPATAQCPAGQVAYNVTESSVGSVIALCTPITPNLCVGFINLFYITSTTMASYNCGTLITSGTNASVVIQTTMNDCNKPCHIILGNGTFIIGNMFLTPKNFVVLDGQGKQVTILKLAAGVARPIMFENVGALYNFTVQNIGFDGNKFQQTEPVNRGAGELILIAGRGNQHVYFLDDLCQNARTGACLDLTGADVEIGRSVLQNEGVTGAAFPSDAIHMGGSNVTLNARIHDNYINNVTDTGLAMDNVRGSIISANDINNARASLFTLDNGSQADTVTSNTFNQTLYSGSWFQSLVIGGSSAQNVTMAGNNYYCNNQTTATNVNMFLMTSVKSFTISGGTMTTSIQNLNDFIFKITSSNNWNIEGVTMTSTFNTNAMSLLFVNGGSNYTVENNHFYGGHFGIQFASNVANFGLIQGNSFSVFTQAIFYANNFPTNTVIRNNIGYDAVGKVTNFIFTTGGNFFAPWGTAPTTSLVASTTYTITAVDQIITCTGGSTVSITITDNHANTLVSGATTLTLAYLPVGDTINFGAFTGTITCVDQFN